MFEEMDPMDVMDLASFLEYVLCSDAYIRDLTCYST